MCTPLSLRAKSNLIEAAAGHLLRALCYDSPICERSSDGDLALGCVAWREKGLRTANCAIFECLLAYNSITHLPACNHHATIVHHRPLICPRAAEYRPSTYLLPALSWSCESFRTVYIHPGACGGVHHQGWVAAHRHVPSAGGVYRMADALPVQHTALAELLSDLSRQFLRSASSRSGSQPGEPQLPGDQAELLERICTAHHQQERIADAAAESELWILLRSLI